MLSFYVVLALIVGLISTVSLSNGEALWISVACWGFFAFMVLGVVDAALSFVKLGDNEMQYRQNFRTTTVTRSDIESVEVAKGCPVTLILKDGSHINVPSLGANEIGNSLRAWIHAT
jgi:hypothetical protein